MLWISEHIQIPETELSFSFARSSGPGGQAVNKVNSKAILRWNFRDSQSLSLPARARFISAFQSRLTKDGEVLVSSDTHRDQRRNQEACRERLKAMILEIALPPKIRKATKPTKGSKERKLDGKKRVGANKALRRKVSFD